MDTDQLTKLKALIESMSTDKQEEVLRILLKNKDCVVNEVNDGCIVNLSYAPDSTVHELMAYVAGGAP